MCVSVVVHFLIVLNESKLLPSSVFLMCRDSVGLFDGGPLHSAADCRSSHVSPYVLRLCGFYPREHLPPADGRSEIYSKMDSV